MQIKLKKLLACVCCLAMMITVCAVPVSSDDDTDTAAESSEEVSEESSSADEDAVPRTDEEAMADMELVTENSNLALYKNEKEATIALEDKNTGKIWWANPINADLSAGKKAQIQELKSGMTLVYGEPSKRRTTIANSKAKGKAKFKNVTNGLKVTYTFSSAGITIPVTYTLESDYLKLYVDTSEIEEKDSDKIVCDLSFLTTFGAA